MMELCRLLQQKPIKAGIDFVCFDAEDMGTPQWAETEESDSHTWCLGSKFWAEKAREDGYRARYGVLLDMVGGRGSVFPAEKVSLELAQPIVSLIWRLGNQIGYGHYFPLNKEGGYLMDDHVNVNRYARIPCIDIVPYFTDGPSRSCRADAYTTYLQRRTMTINEIQDEIIEEFADFDDWMDRYQLLIDLGSEQPPLDNKYKTEQNLIDGCQSRVWLQADMQDGLVHFQAESDALIVKGIVALLIRVLSDHTPQEILDADLYFIEKIGLREHLSPTRSNGLLAMLKQMKLYALAFKAIGPSPQPSPKWEGGVES